MAPDAPSCVGATSLLVMHSLPDDGTKLRYLQSIRSRLEDHAPLVLADISFDNPAEFERAVPAFLEHARRAGVAAHHSGVDPHVMPTMPIVGDRRTRDLLEQAAFGDVTPFYRGFWYAGWWARAIWGARFGSAAGRAYTLTESVGGGPLPLRREARMPARRVFENRPVRGIERCIVPGEHSSGALAQATDLIAPVHAAFVQAAADQARSEPPMTVSERIRMRLAGNSGRTTGGPVFGAASR